MMARVAFAICHLVPNPLNAIDFLNAIINRQLNFFNAKKKPNKQFTNDKCKKKRLTLFFHTDIGWLLWVCKYIVGNYVCEIESEVNISYGDRTTYMGRSVK